MASPAQDKASKSSAIPRKTSRRVTWGRLSLGVVAVLVYCIPQFEITRNALNSVITSRVNQFVPFDGIADSLGLSSLGGHSSGKNPCNSRLSAWIEDEAALSWKKIFEQTGPAAGALEGFVIASPSTKDPDYLYTWTRDSAIVTSAILEKLLRTGDTALEASLRLYAYSQKSLQRVCNPSGCFENGMHGLGEPKYNVDGTAFTGPWGRPQRDGPALRAITLVGFADYLLQRGTPQDIAFVKEHLYASDMPAESVIKADLEYVARYWKEHSFDLWEEIDGHHFFTYIASLRALSGGAALATKLGDTNAAAFYSAQATQIEEDLHSFVSMKNGVVLAYKEPKQFNRTGLDAAVPLGVLVSGAQGASDWGPASDHILATLKAYVDSFRDEYKINKGEKKLAVATGRYAEDVYDGIGVSIGNPWYLTTLSVSHAIARALQYYTSTQSPIWINHINKPFWAQFDDKIHSGEVLTHKDKR
ncbi:Glucoamylase, intracellular sporulation-specific, partial [Tulasnella sp. 417]